MLHRLIRSLVRSTLGALIAASLFCGTTEAGTTGKIAGVVTDGDGAPMPGVAVFVEGTRLGVVADADGRYSILLVPPGPHSVSGQMVGYRTMRVTGVVVRADLTTEVNLRLEEEALAVDAVVVTAERLPIERDVTSSQTIVDSRAVADAPVSEILDYMAFEPGVSIAEENELRIRGGAADEIRFQVDDLDRTDALTNKGLTHLNLTLVSEVTVLTGGFNAEYGNMRSGIVNAVFKDGTERGWGMPWVAAVYSVSPARRKHFGPGAYDQDQYDYWLMADPEITGSGINNLERVVWPDLYENTANDSALQARVDALPEAFTTFVGWDRRAVWTDVIATVWQKGLDWARKSAKPGSGKRT